MWQAMAGCHYDVDDKAVSFFPLLKTKHSNTVWCNWRIMTLPPSPKIFLGRLNIQKF